MYAIAAGSYSDYRVEKVTNDYLLAQQYCAYKNSEHSEYLSRDDTYRIENIDLLEDVFKCEDCDIVFNYEVTLVFDRNKYGLTYKNNLSIVVLRSNSILRDHHAYNVYDWYDEKGGKSYITLYNIVVDKKDKELATAIALERAYVMLYELDCNITTDRVCLYDIMLSGHEPVRRVNLVIKFTIDDEFVIKNIEIDSMESHRWWTWKESSYEREGTVTFFRRIEHKDIKYFLKVYKSYYDLYDVESDEDIFNYFKNIISEPRAIKNLIKDLEESERDYIDYSI